MDKKILQMIKFLLIWIFLLCEVAIFAQEKVITGKVTDNIGKPLAGVLICQINSINCTSTDHNGLFHLLIDEKHFPQLEFECIGYQTLTISNLDTISGLLKVKLPVDTLFNKFYYEIYPKRKLKYGFISFIQADLIFNDFGDFRPLLKDYNIDLMNKSSGIFSVELAGTYKRYYAGFNLGWANDCDYKHDSLDIIFNTTQYGLHFGYNLINSKRLLFTPKVAIKWNRYRLLNNDKNKSITIGQYISERDLDIRFNQMIGFVGLNLSYKIYNFNLFSADYWTFGVYGGYAFKLHDNPWIYSRGNRLRSSEKIKIENYNIGVLFSFNIDRQ